MSVLDAVLGRDDGPQERTLPMSVGALCDLLRNERRRHVIRIVASGQRATPAGEWYAIDRGELATRVAAREAGVAPERVDTDARKAVYVCLYQSHLDTMAAAGVIEQGDRETIVRATEHTVSVADELARIEDVCGGETA